MENLLGNLKRENKEREKRLIVSDRRILSDMVGYMKTQKICDYDIELVRKTIIRNALRSYGRKKNLTHLVGDDYRKYCDKLCENTRRATGKELIFSRGVTAIYAMALMYMARLVDIVMTGGSFMKEPVEINLGYLAAAAVILLGTLVMYYYIFRIMKQKGTQMSTGQTGGMIAILIVIIGLAYAGAYFLSDIHLFNVIWWVPVALIALIYILFKILYIQYENQMAKEA